jgi:hypothetical protein
MSTDRRWRKGAQNANNQFELVHMARAGTRQTPDKIGTFQNLNVPVEDFL